MKSLKQLLSGAIAAAAIATLSMPASAQFYGRGVMGEDMVLESLRDRGFRRMSPPVLNRDVFVLDAVDPRGRPVRLIVSAFNGVIVDAHPQRGGQWSRVEVDRWGDEERPRRRWQRDIPDADEDWRDGRWRDRQARIPDRDIDERWGRRGDRDAPGRIEPEDDRQSQEREPQTGTDDRDRNPRRQQAPERVTVSPLPAPPTMRDPDLPVPTLKNPTIVKRSPTAIPKDPNEPKAPAAAAITPTPRPGAGTKDNPRVIDLTPKASTKTTGSSAQPSEPARTAATSRAPQGSGLPPPTVLENLPKPPAPAQPSFAPATTE